MRCLSFCLLLSIGIAGCSVKEGLLGSLAGGNTHFDGSILSDGRSLSDIGRLSDGGSLSDDGAPPVSACPDSLRIKIPGHDTCTGRLASTSFTNALCTCGNLRLGDVLTTAGFDSNEGIYLEGELTDNGASVGVNGNYSQIVGKTDVGGTFSIAGGGTLQILGGFKADGDFFFAGSLSVTGATTVSRHAWLGGNFNAVGPLIVSGDFHHTGSVSAIPVLVSGANLQQPVTVAKPCPCEASELIPIAELVAAAKTNNENQILGITPDDLAAITSNKRWSLSCGRYYLSRIAGTGNLAIRVTGKVALFIDGSIDLKGTLSFDLDSGAEIDVFVKQDLQVQGPLALANKNRPAAGRMWVGGTQAIRLSSPFIGNLYAPRANVGSTIALEIWGSIFAADFTVGAVANVYYDRAILSMGATCKAPLPTVGECTQCQWCPGGSACVAGTCSACRSDSDCCSLLVCNQGACAPLVLGK